LASVRVEADCEPESVTVTSASALFEASMTRPETACVLSDAAKSAT
jgi:hypothetical protein